MKRLIFAAAALALPLSIAQSAQAGIDSCGNIDVRANAKCEVVVEGGCTAKCTPISFRAQCSAELYATCDTTCTEPPSIECTGSCSGGCVAECQANANFDCTGACKADCGGDCSGRCTTAMDQAKCEASCSATCDGECSGSCKGQANADCNAQCNACCSGSCTVDSNWSCQTECQAKGYAKCEAELKGGCEASCTAPEGALFCDGQYVDVGNNLEDCINSLKAELNITVEGYAKGECENGTCKGEAGGSIGCAVTPARSVGGGALGFAAALLGAALLGRRQRRQSR